MSASCRPDRPAEEGHRRPERHHREREEPGDDRERRRDPVDPGVGVRRVDRLLEEELDPVGERQQHTAGAGAHRTRARLEVGDHLALHPDHEQHGHEEAGEHDHDLAEQDAPVDPGHAGSPPTAAGAGASSAALPGASSCGASAASSSTVATNAPDEQRVRREPRLVERHEHGASAIRSVTRAGRTASPAAVRRRTPRPSARPWAAASSGCTSTTGGSPSAACSSGVSCDHPPVVDQQRVGDERDPVRREPPRAAAPARRSPRAARAAAPSPRGARRACRTRGRRPRRRRAPRRSPNPGG